MITSITLRNYKSFDNVTIPIKPITVLLGANNTGKSTIVNALMMLRQTAEETAESFDQPLKIIGEYVNMGPVDNLFPKKKAVKPLEICITISPNDFLEIREKLIENFTYTLSYIEDVVLGTKRTEPTILPLGPKLDIEQFEEYYNYHYHLLKRNKQKFKKYHFFSSIFLSSSDKENSRIQLYDILRIFNFLRWLKTNIVSSDFVFKYSIKVREREKKRVLYISKFGIFNAGNCLIEFTYNNKKDCYLNSDISIESAEAYPILESFDNTSPIFDCFNKIKDISYNNVFVHYFVDYLNSNLQVFRNQFLKGLVNFVDPLRAYPERFYVLEQKKIFSDFNTMNGRSMVGVLKNKDISDQVNNWFKKFGLRITVKELQDEIHKLTINDSELELNIYDVGFGISQLLPIIIKGFMSKSGTLTVIEQPEIHLHPQLQADLADLFIDIIYSQKLRSVIIETHSEYLLRRLRRRISEGKIKSNQVSICLFENINTFTSKVEIAEIEDKGYFEWPKDFMDKDLLDDITEFIKNQIV